MGLKRKSLIFRFKNKIVGNGRVRNVIEGRFVHKMKKFKCLGSIVLDNERIVKDIAS